MVVLIKWRLLKLEDELMNIMLCRNRNWIDDCRLLCHVFSSKIWVMV